MRLAKSIGVVSLTILLLFLIKIQGNKMATVTPTDDPFNGALYYDSNAGGLVQYDGQDSGLEWVTGTSPAVYSPAYPNDYNPNPTYSSYNSAGVNTTPKPAPVDPYAKWGGQGAYNNLVAGFTSGLNSINTTGSQAAKNLSDTYGLDIVDYANSLRTSQAGIDNSRINNFANQQLGQRQVNQMVGEGIQSGGVMLANKNAGDSSAAEALARAYGQVGQNRMQGVNNQFEAGNRDVMAAQQNLDTTNAAGLNRLRTESQVKATQIVTDARNEMNALKQRQLTADLPTSIEIEQEIQGIQAAANQAVANIDAFLTEQTSGITGMDTNTAQSKAFANNNAGNAPTNYQNYTTNVPTQMRGGASVPSSLPIFTYRGNNKEA